MKDKGQSHPHLYDRMLAVGFEPDFPRPTPPSDHENTPIIGGVAVIVVCWMLPMVSELSLALVQSGVSEIQENILGVAFRTDEAWSLESLAHQAYKNDDLEAAVALYGGCMPWSQIHPMV